MKNRLPEYLTKLIISLLVVAYLLTLMEKVGFGIKLLDVGILIQAAILFVFIWVFLKLKSLTQFLIKMKKALAKIDFLLPKGLVGWVLVAILLFIFFDIFSIKQTNDITTLVVAGVWILASTFVGMGGRVSVGTGLFFLAFCPFLIILGREQTAEKSAVWAYMFLVAGVIQEILFPPKVKPAVSKRASLFDFFTQLQRSYSTLIGKIGDFQAKPAVIGKKKRKVAPSELPDSELSKPAKEIGKVAWEIYTSLNEQEKKNFGNRQLELADSIGLNIVEAYGTLEPFDKIKLYKKAKNSLIICRYQTELMEERKIGDKKLLEKLKVLLNKEEKHLNDLISSTHED